MKIKHFHNVYWRLVKIIKRVFVCYHFGVMLKRIKDTK